MALEPRVSRANGLPSDDLRARSYYGRSNPNGTQQESGQHRIPLDPDGLFSEGGKVIKLHSKGSLTIPTPGIKRVELLWKC